ncbi:MAG: methyltransferase [Mariniphaga sp.]|nr:methyltransferase [Mariniphaga sp.]
MGRNNYFQFKQFTVIQEKSAMKVGTDGVLLGAWANVSNAKEILDVGTGTGVIALMMAQRSNAKITAIEIEKNSFKEASFNFQNSPWSNRFISINDSFQNYSSNSTEKYDLIISNPPFFENVSKALNQNRSNARHNDLLPFQDLIQGSFKLLNDTGRLAIVIPTEQSERIIFLAETIKLYIERLTKVKPKPGKPSHRHLIEFSMKKLNPLIDELTIEKETHHNFTMEYKNLTKDFYLAF